MHFFYWFDKHSLGNKCYQFTCCIMRILLSFVLIFLSAEPLNMVNIFNGLVANHLYCKRMFDLL